ncbi:MAG: hypothetical protein ACI81P_002302 [Neolewinella sp.]|jgi:hypothetical protein
MLFENPHVASCGRALLGVRAVNDGFGFPFSGHVGYARHLEEKGQQYQTNDKVQDDSKGRGLFLLSDVRHVRAMI